MHPFDVIFPKFPPTRIKTSSDEVRLATGAGATGAAGAAAPVALVVRGQRGGSEVPFLKNWFRRNVNAVKKCHINI